MLDKIRIIKQRYDEVSDLIIQPEIIMDQKRYAQLMKEYKDLGSVVVKGDEYQTLTNNIEEAKEILADGSDDTCELFPSSVQISKIITVTNKVQSLLVYLAKLNFYHI